MKTTPRIILAIFLFAGAAIIGYLQLPMFGKLPDGKRLSRIQKSPRYRDGKFRNVHETYFTGAVATRIAKFLFSSRKHLDPKLPPPALKTNLETLGPNEDALVWFGHSSCLFRLDGKTFLTDPIFSETSSPILFWPRVFAGTNIYRPEDMPRIDYLIITHDHWDHLDYETVLKLKPKIGKIICPLGVGAHFERWGFDEKMILETDWYESVVPEKGITIICCPARHFSGRGVFGNRTLWASFLVKTETFSVYVGGDGGYDDHCAEIGNRFGPIDLALLNCGQYDAEWKHNHMTPEEAVRAAKDLRARKLLPVHVCKLPLAFHNWKEPLERVSKAGERENVAVMTPMIGEKIPLRSECVFSGWWEECE
ncbi:MAG: MBL fold metallo-hydrolase [Holosporaceae bacterium]|jgi:L-ascorbate metabolism protein UlaG (beta-lactamase superfamily)|nr:MBL fold metallo-hydrolase [Holosporaceae bacterium]